MLRLIFVEEESKFTTINQNETLFPHTFDVTHEEMMLDMDHSGTSLLSRRTKINATKISSQLEVIW